MALEPLRAPRGSSARIPPARGSADLGPPSRAGSRCARSRAPRQRRASATDVERRAPVRGVAVADQRDRRPRLRLARAELADVQQRRARSTRVHGALRRFARLDRRRHDLQPQPRVAHGCAGRARRRRSTRAARERCARLRPRLLDLLAHLRVPRRPTSASTTAVAGRPRRRTSSRPAPEERPPRRTGSSTSTLRQPGRARW